MQQIGGEPQCTIMASGIRSSPVNAALDHGTMVHVLDYEEAILRRANHPSNVLFPVVLPLGEQMGLARTGGSNSLRHRLRGVH